MANKAVLTLVNQFTKIMVEHFNKARLFKMSYYGENQYSDYYLTGTLNSFFAEQEFSTAAAVGANFGLVGALASSGIKMTRYGRYSVGIE